MSVIGAMGHHGKHPRRLQQGVHGQAFITHVFIVASFPSFKRGLCNQTVCQFVPCQGKPLANTLANFRQI